MKKLLIAFSMVGAGALIACATDNSVKPNYDSAEWFSASASGETIIADGGEFKKNASSESTFKANEGKIEIYSELEDPVWFELDSDNTKTTGLAKVTFELDASVVQESALPKGLDGVKTAFALVASTDKTTTNFQAWVKQSNGAFGWQGLTFKTPDADGSYDITMRFDDSATEKKVQFAVMLEGAQNEEVSDWYTYGGLAIDSKPQIDFVGCGKLKSMNADQVWIVSSEVVIEGGGSVTIDDKDMGAMNKLAAGGEIETVLAADVSTKFTGATGTGPAIVESCKLNVAEAYAIGLIANENGTMVAKADGTFKVKADAQANVSGGIPVGFVTPLTPNDTTAAFSYQLQGLVDEETGYVNVGGSVSTPDAIKIPTDKVGASTDKDGNPTGKYRYFKVVTTVKLQNAPEN